MDAGATPTIEWIKLGISVITLGSIVIAFLGYHANKKKLDEDRIREKDRELVSQVQKSFQWAYEVLAAGHNDRPPPPDRLAWLTAARHLLRTERLALQIESPTYKTIFAETEEYWRHMFYLALNHSELQTDRYFTRTMGEVVVPGIEPRSALVVYKFSKWNDLATDPIDEVNQDQLLAELPLLRAEWRGLHSYINYLQTLSAR